MGLGRYFLKGFRPQGSEVFDVGVRKRVLRLLSLSGTSIESLRDEMAQGPHLCSKNPQP